MAQAVLDISGVASYTTGAYRNSVLWAGKGSFSCQPNAAATTMTKLIMSESRAQPIFVEIIDSNAPANPDADVIIFFFLDTGKLLR